MLRHEPGIWVEVTDEDPEFFDAACELAMSSNVKVGFSGLCEWRFFVPRPEWSKWEALKKRFGYGPRGRTGKRR